ncbi:hypothetical protein RBA41_03455 [Massilia sp. CCM 9210]|uniref:hypothetical protein n=1 Tax=Massilia scottii TaxID=3057166 RepID=UPI002796D167|nr:hypothetical protein [Massilia sp. CCM 9210]MDQ1812351.1 hypothetical protein [Massilia sp. CCM 9210]
MGAPDEAQRYVLQQAMAAKQKPKQAEAAKGSQRKALMGEHLTMMKEVMDKHAVMKPKEAMSGPGHEEWMKEHQALMPQMMEQMMGQQHPMMETTWRKKAAPASATR